MSSGGAWSSGCTIGTRDGILFARWRSGTTRHRRSLGLRDTALNRTKAEVMREKIVAALALGHDPRVTIFEEVAPAAPPPSEATSTPSLDAGAPDTTTIARYYDEWIVTKRPPLVRKAQARDYTKHLNGYVLPSLGDLPLAELRTKHLRALVADLLDRQLSVKYVKNIVAGSFRALVRDWCVDANDAPNPFDRLPRGFWPKITPPAPDPFTPAERDRIVAWFAGQRWHVHAARATAGHPRVRVHPAYTAMIHLLAWTGMRPSEACGLQWQDVDLARGTLEVRRSRHLGELSAPKTRKAARTVFLVPETVTWLQQIQPLHVRPGDFVFRNVDGRPVDQRKLAERFHQCLRALEIRVRGLYCLKDTYVTQALAQDVRDDWIEAQTGVALSTLKRHYATYDAAADSRGQIERLTGGGTRARTGSIRAHRGGRR